MKVKEKKSNEKPIFDTSHNCVLLALLQSHISLPPVPIVFGERQGWREGPMHGHYRGVKSGMDRKQVSKFDRLLMHIS